MEFRSGLWHLPSSSCTCLRLLRGARFSPPIEFIISKKEEEEEEEEAMGEYRAYDFHGYLLLLADVAVVDKVLPIDINAIDLDQIRQSKLLDLSREKNKPESLVSSASDN